MLLGLDFAPAAMFLSTAPSSRSRASIRCSAATQLLSPFRMDGADQSKALSSPAQEEPPEIDLGRWLGDGLEALPALSRTQGGMAENDQSATRTAETSHVKMGMARPKRFELLTPRFVVWCSIQLSYGRVDSLKGLDSKP
jgi:hypothetical protein